MQKKVWIFGKFEPSFEIKTFHSRKWLKKIIWTPWRSCDEWRWM